MNRIVIYVSGGIVQEVYASKPDSLRVTVVDDDNLKEHFDRSEREMIFDQETAGLRDVFVHVPSQQEEAEA